jgi:hypothetical protein
MDEWMDGWMDGWMNDLLGVTRPSIRRSWANTGITPLHYKRITGLAVPSKADKRSFMMQVGLLFTHTILR